MKIVGLRELKKRLAECLHQVRSGETILITARGEVVAQINSPSRTELYPSYPSGLIELEKQGLATLGRNDASRYDGPRGSSLTEKEIAELLDEVRGPR